jgi:flagellar FliL protein
MADTAKAQADTAKTQTDAAKQEATPPAKKKSKKGLLIGVVGVLVVGGGAAGYWFTRPAAGASADAHAEPEPEGESVVSFEPFVVNLADGGGGRYLRVNVQLVIGGAAAGAEIEEEAVKKVRLRSGILELLTGQTSDVLMTPEGKEALKHSIGEQASATIEPHKVMDVLFSDFIVQR